MRITGGSLRGRRLTAPKGGGTRPTGDRVRESLFTMLGNLESEVVLDLFAGSGSLGFEALSRGAKRVVFVEKDRRVCQVLKSNLQSLGVGPKAQVICAPARKAASRIEASFRPTLVFADPPYALVEGAEFYKELHWVAPLLPEPEGFPQLVVEHSARMAAPVLAGFRMLERREYGEPALAFYETSTGS